MNRDALQRYIHENLPLTKAMGVTVLDMTEEGIRLGAPLHLNLNHKRTAFGGSLESIATVTCWSTLYVDLMRRGLKAELVIRHCEMSFEHPVEGDFSAYAKYPAPDEQKAFQRMFERRGIARISLESHVEMQGKACAHFKGEFAAVRID